MNYVFCAASIDLIAAFKMNRKALGPGSGTAWRGC